MKKAPTPVAMLPALLLLGGCLFLPVESPVQAHPDCELVTRELDLALVDGGDVFRQTLEHYRGCVNEQCLAVLAALAVVPVGSLVISGSFVLVGNSVHWFEVQGTCDEGLVSSIGRAVSF